MQKLSYGNIRTSKQLPCTHHLFTQMFIILINRAEFSGNK